MTPIPEKTWNRFKRFLLEGQSGRVTLSLDVRNGHVQESEISFTFTEHFPAQTKVDNGIEGGVQPQVT